MAVDVHVFVMRDTYDPEIATQYADSMLIEVSPTSLWLSRGEWDAWMHNDVTPPTILASPDAMSPQRLMTWDKRRLQVGQATDPDVTDEQIAVQRGTTLEAAVDWRQGEVRFYDRIVTYDGVDLVWGHIPLVQHAVFRCQGEVRDFDEWLQPLFDDDVPPAADRPRLSIRNGLIDYEDLLAGVPGGQEILDAVLDPDVLVKPIVDPVSGQPWPASVVETAIAIVSGIGGSSVKAKGIADKLKKLKGRPFVG